MKKPVLLAGNGITAEILTAHIAADSRFLVVGLIADDEFVSRPVASSHETFPLSSLTSVFPADTFSVVMAMGYGALNANRKGLFHRICEYGYETETYVHPQASVSDSAKIGRGSVILAQAVVEPFSSIGVNTFVWPNAVIAHHATIGDHCWIASGAVVAGRASVGHQNFLGVNATVVDGITIGDECVIGANALITKDSPRGIVHLARSAEQIRLTSHEYSKQFGM